MEEHTEAAASIDVGPLITLGLANVPVFIALIRGLFKRFAPDAPTPTDEELIAGLHAMRASTVAIDDGYLATHPAE